MVADLWYNLTENVIKTVRSIDDELELARMVTVIVDSYFLRVCSPLYSCTPVDVDRKDRASL